MSAPCQLKMWISSRKRKELNTTDTPVASSKDLDERRFVASRKNLVDELAAVVRIDSLEFKGKTTANLLESCKDMALRFVLDSPCFGSGGSDVGQVHGLSIVTIGNATVVSDEVSLHEAGLGLIPISEGTNNEDLQTFSAQAVGECPETLEGVKHCLVIAIGSLPAALRRGSLTNNDLHSLAIDHDASACAIRLEHMPGVGSDQAREPDKLVLLVIASRFRKCEVSSYRFFREAIIPFHKDF